MTEGQGVQISDGRSGVRLKRTGCVNELGHPTLIDVQAGPFTGGVLGETVDFGYFRTQLTKLYEVLSGTAILVSYDGLKLVLVGNGRGAIEVKVEITAQHVPLIQLIFEFEIDQTYLPPIIKQLDEEFPPPYRIAL